MATTTSRLGLKVIDTPAVDTVDQLRLSINNHATILDAQYLESTFALRPAAASKGRIHRSTDTGEIAVDTGASWEPIWGTPSVARSVLETGMLGQSRAGRNLAWDDFWDFCGLGALPLAIWNCAGNATDSSGNSRDLTNKGSVPFGIGLAGAASSAAVFAGSTAQALYRADTGGGDPFRIKTGSVGCWFKTAKVGTEQYLVAKYRATGNQRSFRLQVHSTNVVRATVSFDGSTTVDCVGSTVVTDDRWHHAVFTFDGAAVRLYVDGQLEQTTLASGAIFGGTGPLNLGAFDADGTTAAANPHYGRIAAAFAAAEVLTPEQVRILYGVRFAHGGASSGTRRVSQRVTRKRLGSALSNSDFPSNPFRLYNFSAGSWSDANAGPSLAAVSGSPGMLGGPDGLSNSGQLFSATGNTGLGTSDSGFPSGTASRSYGCWFNVPAVLGAAQNLMAWGTDATAHASVFVETSGALTCKSGADTITGPFVADGKWHHFAVVEDNAPGDGVKRKLYLDGVLVGTSTTLTSLTLIGANGFRIGASTAGTQPLAGLVSRAFVFAGALTWEQVQAVRNRSSSTTALPDSPKDAGPNVEAVFGADLIYVGEDLEPHATVNLEVSR